MEEGRAPRRPRRAALRRAAEVLALASLGLLSACGAAAPSEEAIYYDPALRPGVAPATADERGLLERVADAPPGPIEIGGHTFILEPIYAAASGRRCRALSGDERTRLICEAEDGWVFVPDVFAHTAQGASASSPASSVP